MMLLARERASQVDAIAVKAEALVNKIRGVNLMLYNIYCSKKLGAGEVAKRLGVVSDELAVEAKELLEEGERVNSESKRYHDDIALLKEIYTDLTKPIAWQIVDTVNKALEACVNAENACVRVRTAVKEVLEENDETKKFAVSLVKKDAKAGLASSQ